MVFSTLSAAERADLAGFADGFVPPPNSIVVVGRKDGRIVARSFLVAPVHIEGTHILEEYRNGFVLAQLIRAVEREAKNIGVSQLLAYAAEPSVEDYLGRLGYRKMQLTVWEKKL